MGFFLGLDYPGASTFIIIHTCESKSFTCTCYELLGDRSYPPLTGGMIATSSSGLILPFENSTYCRFTATATDDRIFFSLSFGWRASNILNNSWTDNDVSDSVASGKGMISVETPVASFADAK